MAGSVTRDQIGDYQLSQFAAVSSMNRDLLLENIISTVKIAKLFDLPIVHSTIIVGTAAAIANAVYHATGIRGRDLPITLDKLL
jgi:hypothetical protein